MPLIHFLSIVLNIAYIIIATKYINENDFNISERDIKIVDSKPSFNLYSLKNKSSYLIANIPNAIPGIFP